MTGTLFVVATPIGNLEDITLRALRVLREADLIAAEDTRRTARLLAHHGITTPTLSFHEHNTQSRLPRLLARLRAGERIALVTDAGTPGVSDPGIELVAACAAEGIPIDPVPGVSAPLTAAIASGFPLEPLTIYGFAPSKAKTRNGWLQELAKLSSTFTFFEAPHRIRQTLTEAAPYFGERPICLGRELTKVHQEFLRGTAAELSDTMTEPRGEFTIVVGPLQITETAIDIPSDTDLAHEFGRLTNSGEFDRRGAVSALAVRFGMSSRAVYGAIERAKYSGE